MNAVAPTGFPPNAKLEKNCLFTAKKHFKIIDDFSYVSYHTSLSTKQNVCVKRKISILNV